MAEHRIRGAMLNYLRKLDPLPRAVRQFAKQRQQVAERLGDRSGQSPSDDEVAAELGLPITKYRRFMITVRAASNASLDSEPARERDLSHTDSGVAIERALLSETVRRTVDMLPPLEAQVVQSVFDGRSPREIASQMHVSESYVSLLKASAIRQLRLAFRGSASKQLTESNRRR